MCSGFVHDIECDSDALRARLKAHGFLDEEQSTSGEPKRQKSSHPLSYEVPREIYAKMYGPTTGDIIRLADSELYIRVERDHTSYGVLAILFKTKDQMNS